MLIRKPELFRFACGLLVVGLAFLIGPPYKQYCEYAYADKYYCTAYKIAIILGDFVELHNGAITALATAAIGYFTWTIWRINKSQLTHAHKVERAYISGRGAPQIDVRNIQKSSFQPGPHGRHGGRASEKAGTRDHVVTIEQVRKYTGNFEVHINNHGKTPGQLFEIGFNFCEGDAIPETPDYQWHSFPDWIGPGTQSRPYFRPIPIPKYLKDPVIYARFRYADIFGDKHSCGFIQRGGEPIRAPDAYTYCLELGIKSSQLAR